jgi:hypothetical protein
MAVCTEKLAAIQPVIEQSTQSFVVVSFHPACFAAALF